MPEEIRLSEDALLFKRATSPFWYVRGKNAKGDWKIYSTKESDPRKARLKAFPLLMQDRQSRTTTFGYYSAIEYEDLLKKRKPIHTAYASVIRVWLDPFFAKKQLSEITNSDLERHFEWREKVTQGKVSKSAVNTTNVVIRRILQRAIDHGVEVPKLRLTTKDIGQKTERRPQFTVDEYSMLMTRAGEWTEQAPRWESRYKREMLQEMMSIIRNSGIRPGSEIRALRIKDVSVVRDENGRYVRIHITAGKTGGRICVGRGHLEMAIRTVLHIRRHAEPDHLLFAMPDNSPFVHESEMFQELMKFAGFVPEGHTLYSLRHLYISEKLVSGVPAHVVAKQCGTSTEMISRHYDHTIPEQYKDLLRR